MGMAQEAHGLLHLSLLQKPSNIGRAHCHAVQSHLGQHIAADAQLPALFLEPLGIACAFIAEMEVIAADQMPGPQLTV